MYSSVELCTFTLLRNQSPELCSSYKLKLYPSNSSPFPSPPSPWQPSRFIFKTAFFNIIHKPYMHSLMYTQFNRFWHTCRVVQPSPQFPDILITPQKETLHLSKVTPYSFFSQPLTTANLLSVSIVCLFWHISYKWTYMWPFVTGFTKGFLKKEQKTINFYNWMTKHNKSLLNHNHQSNGIFSFKDLNLYTGKTDFAKMSRSPSKCHLYEDLRKRNMLPKEI